MNRYWSWMIKSSSYRWIILLSIIFALITVINSGDLIGVYVGGFLIIVAFLGSLKTYKKLKEINYWEKWGK